MCHIKKFKAAFAVTFTAAFRFVTLHLITYLFISILLLALSSTTATAQGLLYSWGHKIATTTAEQDSSWSAANAWYDVTIYTDSLDLWYKLGAPDTASWSSRDFIFLPAGASLYIGPSTRLRRIAFKTVAGTADVYFVGRKRRRQY